MKKFMLIMLALVIAGLALAQTDITIGTGTTTGRYPLNDYYVYSRSQCIYLESEIGAPGTIHKLRWYRNDTGADANAIGTTQIWLKTVSNAVMTDVNWEDPGTMVAEITDIDLGAGNGWYEIDITDFAYAGGNLLVSAYTQNASFTTPHAYWRYTTTTGFNRCRLGNSDSSNPPTLSLSTARPNIQINMTAGAPSVAPNPAILAAPMNGGYAMIGDILSWNSGGGFPVTYDVYLDTVDGSTLVSDNQAGLTYTPTLAPGTTYYWKVVPANAFGDAAGCPVWSFMTPGATQLAESFELTAFPPAGWANGTTGTWSRSTSYAKHGTASAYKYGSTTTAYVLSTPRLTIEHGSTLDIWTLASSATGTLQVVYSPDRVTWTPLGTPIAHAATYVWYNTVADLSSLAGNNYYLGIQTGLQSASFYVDLAIAPEITPEAPGAPALSAPADLAINVSEFPTLSWTAPTTGGVPTGYNLYMDTVDGSTLYASGVSSPYVVPVVLDYETTYYWTVEALNGAGTGPQATVRSFTTRANPTISTFPWEVNFGTVSGDWPVLNWSQMAGLYGTTPVAGTQWFQDDFVNVTTPLNKSAKINIYSTTRNGWLVTPPIAIPAAGYELKFDIGLTAYGSTSAVTAGGQPDDKFMVLVDDNPNMSSPTILREWNNTGSPYVLDNVSNIGENHIIDLDAYTGTVYFAFYGESSVSNADNDFFVDNVIVRETPSAPVFSISPTSKDFGLVELGTTATQVFTISNTGVGVLELGDIEITEGAAQYSISVPVAPESMNLATGETATFTVAYAPTAVETNDGSILINYTGGSSTVALTGEGYLRPAGSTYQNPYFVTLPLVDFADNTALYGDDYESTWVSPASYYLGGDDMVLQFTLDQPSTLSGTLTATNGTYIGMIFVNSAPSVATPAPVLALAVSSSGSTATLAATEFAAGTYSVLISTWPSPQAVTFLLNLNAEPIVVVAPGAPVLVSPANEAAGIPATGFELSWTPGADGGTPDYYAVYMSTEAENLYDDLYFEVETASFNPVVDGAVSFNYNERWYWTVEAYNTEGSALQETPFWFTIQDDPTVVVDADNPYTENFDAIAVGAMPANWTLFESHTGADARGWKAGENIVANSLPNAAVVYYHSSYAKDEWMITPPLALEGGQLYTLSFAMKAPGWQGAPEALKVHFGTEATIAGMTANTPLWDNNNITQAEFTTLLLPFTPATTGTYYFGWHAYSNADNDFVAVDDISLFIPADTDIALSGFTGDTLAMVASPANYNVSVANLGANDINAYTITIKDQVTLMPLATASITTPLLAGNTATHELSWTPATEGDFAIIAEVSADGDLVPANNSSAPILVTVYPETMNILYVGDPASTLGTSAYPFDMYYEDFVAETVYLASEIQATSGTIEALIYTNSFTSAQTRQIQIWMQNTTAEDLSAGWLPWADYSLVFDGEIDFAAGMNYIQIPITPFSYTGNNLAIRTSRTWMGEWTQDNLWLVTPDPAGRIRTRYQREDSEFVDHTNPTGTLSTANFPNVIFFLDSDSMVASTATPQPEISLDSAAALLEWPPVPYAYSYNVYASNDPYNFTDVVPTTIYDNSYVPADEDASFFKVTSSTYRDLDRAQPNFTGNVSVSNRINAENQRTKQRTKLSAVK